MIMRLQSSCNNRSFFLAMVAATSACLRSHVGMYLCSYFQAAFGKTSQGVDPEDNDFQVPRLLCVGPFLGSLGRPFFLSRFSIFFLLFCSILGPIFGSVFGTQNWASESGFNRILCCRAKAEPHIWVHFWYPFLGPRF